MTNTFPSSSPGASAAATQPEPSVRMPPRRSSYASVAAGTATATPQSQAQSPHARSGAFSHLTDPNSNSPNHDRDPEQRPQAPPYSHENNPYLQHMGIGVGVANPWGRGNSIPNYSNNFALGGRRFDMGSTLEGLIKPSYLSGTRYMERLESAQRAKLVAQREAAAAAAHNPNTGTLSSSSSNISLHRMAPSHRGMTYEIVEHQPVMEDETVPPLPTKWAEVDRHGGLEVQADGHDIRYSGPQKVGEHEACAARTDHPMPPQCGIYYYEVHVKSKGKEGVIGIGFSSSKVSLEKLPGWEPDSWAYHGDDGKSFCGQSPGKTYGETFTTGDVVGCGVNFMTGCAFFTKNGIFQGIAFRDIKGVKLYPSIGIKRPGASIKVNFGQDPFFYDIDGMVAREKATVKENINLVNVAELYPTPSEDVLIKQLISQFLRHDGYVETAKAFAEEIRSESNALKNSTDTLLETIDVQEDLDAVNRQHIRAAILDGDVDKALKRTHAYYPYVLRDNPRINFRLRCRKFVEMMRYCTELLNGSPERKPKSLNGHTDDVFEQAMDLDDPASNGDDWDRMDTEEIDNGMKYQEKLEETLRYAQELKYEYKDDPSKEVKDTLQEIFSLFAYQDPRRSPTAPLLDASGRVPVAEELNSAILVSLGKSSSAALERLCQQTEVLVDEISEQGGAGAFINIDDDYLR